MPVNNENKAGYKHTALGWIPEEWKIVQLSAVALILFSNVDKHIHLNEKPILLCNYTDVYYNRFIFSGLNFSKGSVKKEEFNKFQLKKGDVVITKDSEDRSDIAVSSYVLEDIPDLVCGYHLAIVRSKREKLNGLFLSHVFQEQKVNNYFQKRANGITRFGLNTDTVRHSYIPLPSLQEQWKIASILSIWDEATAKIQQLIAQLQQRNKGLMQQLLSGKKRLKGFEGEWRKFHATDIFKSVSVKNKGTERLLSATQDRGIIPRDMLEARVTMPTGETGSFKLVEVGDFVISLRSFQGGIEYSEYRGLVSPAYTVLKPTIQISTSFFKHYFKSYDFIGHLAVAVIGIRDGKQVSYEDFSILKLPYPAIEEQGAIAKVLDSAVNEVKLCEQRLAFLRQQKKGLMQKLLTGEVRTI